MIDKSALTAVLERGMEGTDLFLVDVRISKDNNIVVEIDPVSIYRGRGSFEWCRH